MKTQQNNDKNITNWGLPNEVLPSQYGSVTYREWCALESKRLNDAGRQCVVGEQAGMVAIISV